MQTRLRCLFRSRYNTVEGRAISYSYPLYKLFQLLQKKHTNLKKFLHRVRLICDSYAQVIAVTIMHTLQLRSMAYFLVWQLRSIRLNFLIPISAIFDPAAAVSHTQKINRSHDSLHAQYGRRTRCRVDTFRESLYSPCSASAILIDRNCAWS